MTTKLKKQKSKPTYSALERKVRRQQAEFAARLQTVVEIWAARYEILAEELRAQETLAYTHYRAILPTIKSLCAENRYLHEKNKEMQALQALLALWREAERNRLDDAAYRKLCEGAT